MKKYALVSNYTIAQFKVQRSKVNNDPIDNAVNQSFDTHDCNQTVVSDLTYVRVGNKWHYVCVLVDLFNREIIGQSVGPNKDALLVKKAFDIKRSLSRKGNPYDNAVAEATLKKSK